VLPDPQLEQTKEQMPKIIASDNFRRQSSGLFRQELVKLKRVANKDIESGLNIFLCGCILHFTFYSLYHIKDSFVDRK